MPGPKPLPVEVKRKRGTLRTDRTPAPMSVVPPAQGEQIPAHFGPAGAQMWRFVTEKARHWLAETDLPTVRLLCDAMDRRAELIALLGNDGYVLYTDKGYAYAHPAAGTLATTEGQITKWMSSLGLNSSDRGRLGVAEVKAMSKLEELRSRQGRAG